MNLDNKLLSIIVPAYNEEAVINIFHSRLVKVLKEMPCSYEIIYVNDGSIDKTLEQLRRLCVKDFHCRVIDLSRNFGKEIAMSAGFDNARGDAVIVIDSDLQDPPEIIPRLFSAWEEGFDVVYAQRAKRQGETAIKKFTAKCFYRIASKLGNINIPRDTGDFRLLSRRAVDSLVKLREQHRFMKGLFSWIGYSQKAVTYNREKRFAGETKWNYWKLWNFAVEGFTSFTILPLKVFSYIGIFVSCVSFFYACIIIFKTLVFGDPARGYPSMMVVILFLGGIQLIGIGVLGEYLGRIFNETKNRPLYLIRERIGFDFE